MTVIDLREEIRRRHENRDMARLRALCQFILNKYPPEAFRTEYGKDYARVLNDTAQGVYTLTGMRLIENRSKQHDETQD